MAFFTITNEGAATFKAFFKGRELWALERLNRTGAKGVELVNIRIWYRDEGGDYRPSKKGVAFKLDLLPDVLAALGKAMKGGGA